MNKENIDVIKQKLKYATGKNHNKLRLDKITEKFDNPAYQKQQKNTQLQTMSQIYAL